MLDVEDKPVVSHTPEEDSPKPDITALVEFLTESLDVRTLATAGLFFLAIFYTLYFARPFFLPLTLAFFLNLLLSPVVRALAKAHIPEFIGAALVLGVVLGAAAYALTQVSRPATAWLESAPQSLQLVEDRVRQLKRHFMRITEAAQRVQETTDAGEKDAPTVAVKTDSFAVSALGWTKAFVTQTVFLVILLYFLLASGNLFTLKLVKVLPRLEDKKRAVEIAHVTEQTISKYLFTISIINCCLGAAVGLAMYFVGMPNPFMWGVMAAVFNFIPYFGPLAGVAVLAIAGLVQFETWGHGILPPLCYLCLHGVEANLITPTILGRRLTMNPVVIFISLIFWGWLWGVAGAFLAVPILMAFKILCDRFKALSAIGEFLGR